MIFSSLTWKLGQLQPNLIIVYCTPIVLFTDPLLLSPHVYISLSVTPSPPTPLRAFVSRIPKQSTVANFRKSRQQVIPFLTPQL